MKLVFQNIRTLFRKNLWFAVMLVLILAVGSFSICFAIGILYNNRYVELEDNLITKVVFFDLKEEVGYDDNEAVFKECYDVFDGIIKEISVENVEYILEDDNPQILSYVAFTGYEAGEYTLGNSVKEIISYQISEGRNLDEEDSSLKKHVALACSGYAGDKIRFGNSGYEIVGVRSLGELGSGVETFIIPVTAWDNNPVNTIRIELDRLPTMKEYKELKNILSRNFGDGFELSEYKGTDGDNRALFLTVRLTAIGIVLTVLVTVLFLVGYIYEERRYNIAVTRLVGCSRASSVFYLTLEMTVVSLFSSLIGIILFEAVRRQVLIKYYPYTEIIFGVFLYAGVVIFECACVFAEILVMSIQASFKSLKKEITEVRR